MSNDKKIYDLEERTAKFGEDIIEFAKKIPEMRCFCQKTFSQKR